MGSGGRGAIQNQPWVHTRSGNSSVTYLTAPLPLVASGRAVVHPCQRLDPMLDRASCCRGWVRSRRTDHPATEGKVNVSNARGKGRGENTLIDHVQEGFVPHQQGDGRRRTCHRTGVGPVVWNPLHSFGQDDIGSFTSSIVSCELGCVFHSGIALVDENPLGPTRSSRWSRKPGQYWLAWWVAGRLRRGARRAAPGRGRHSRRRGSWGR